VEREKAKAQKIKLVPNGYKVDGEVGRFYFTTHQLEKAVGFITQWYELVEKRFSCLGSPNCCQT